MQQQYTDNEARSTSGVTEADDRDRKEVLLDERGMYVISVVLTDSPLGRLLV